MSSVRSKNKSTSGFPEQAGTHGALTELRLSPPRARPGTVSRSALTERLVSSGSYPLVVISAPAGFGKSTLLAEWAEHDPRAFAWVALDGHDDDPVALFTSIATAVDRVRPGDRGLIADLASPHISVLGRIVPRLLASLRSHGDGLVLVLRNLHEATSQASRDALDLLVDHLPPGVQLAVTSRRSVWLATAGRRGRGQLIEIGPADLAFDEDEAAQLLRAVGAPASPEEVKGLVASTEGWAAGLYLSALALRSGRAEASRLSDAAVHPFVSDYVRSEVLSDLPRATHRFLRRAAVLDLMSGPLCDATLDCTGSAGRLASIAESNLFIVPLDDRGEWYRNHALFRAVLLDDLVRREPDIMPSLHLRAADWWTAHGSVDHAVRHAHAAGDPGRAAHLVATNLAPAYHAGRLPDVEMWLREVGDATVEADPSLAVRAGWIAAVSGRPIEASRWADVVEHVVSPDAPEEDGASFDAVRSMLRACLCAHGVADMARDAELAVDQVPLWSSWRSVAVGLLAVARSMEGRTDTADLLFGEAVEAAQASGAWVVLTRMLAHRGLLCMDRHDWVRAADDVERALAVVGDQGLGEYGSSALVHAASARLAMHRGAVEPARSSLLLAMRLRPLSTWAIPFAAVLLRLEMADLHLALADPHGARVLFRESDEIFHHRPNLGVLTERVERLRQRLDATPDGLGGSTLTGAELRLLPYLQTYLTLGEIGHRLYVSRNTVSTQSGSIYRKLGVSSRSEAVAKARELGLLADDSPV